MKIIFLTFLITVSCGPSEKKRREIEERKRECYLVRGICKTECNSWEYIYNYCNVEPCCVIREYQKPMLNEIKDDLKKN
ncbi:beta-defensin 113 [Orycteropus afer afer]|uniref:Beta-defensin n=1 Tax=Orycteropus afer afer TaxID=1230840 RepID=A0A8B6ZFK6_ORYAF|nr:beta-defensin 113 [Orycteropus afer afer]